MQLLNVIDLGNKISVNPCKIAICQITCPSESEVTKNYHFPQELALSQEQKILDYLNRLEEDIKFVVFPEFCIPENTLSKLITFARKKNIYIIGGLEYDYWLRNQCIIIAPSGKCYKSAKLKASKYDHSEMRGGEYINCFINSGFGDFAVLICYDFTDSNLIQELSGKIDTLFVVSNNPDVNTFSQKAISDCYSSYCFIVICNNSTHGYSGVYGPLDFFKGNKIDKKILELNKGEVCEKLELNITELRKAIEKKTGLKLEDGSRYKYVLSNFSRKTLLASEPQLEYTLLDWPQPFDQDCIIILGSSTKRAIYQLTGHKETFEKIKEIDSKFFENLAPYLPASNKYFIARTSDAKLLPQLTARLIFSPYSKKFLFSWDDITKNSDLLIEFLRQNYDVSWVTKAQIKEISDDKIIGLYDKNRNWGYFSLILKKAKAILTIDEGESREIYLQLNLAGYSTKFIPIEKLIEPADEFDVCIENNKKNIYLRKKPPVVYVDDGVIRDNGQIDPVLKRHNIISIGTSEVNKVSEKINEELRKDGRVYTVSSAEGLRPRTIFDECKNRELDAEEAPDAAIIGLTRNPFNPDKLALLCGGIHGVGTSAAMKFLAENDGIAFRGHRYGLTVFAVSPPNVPKGQGNIENVETIDERKLRD